ncbi:MAG: CDP-alcohol phosphatidyltransferase family protein [bacterium]|nr:CDP-alcohol phosphatidyltransferase family protein [bacterium]
MHRLFKEYKASLKDTAVEEVVDLYFFRPIAFVIVKLIYRLPITPNQISVLSIILGFVSGVFYALGDKKSFFYAGLFYALSHLLDCCDGMIARLKKNGTPIGRIIDGWADYITSVAVYLGLLIGLNNGAFQLPVSPWLLMIPASLSLLFHCMIVDYYRHEFMAHALGKANSIREDMAFFTEELERLNKNRGKYLEKIMIIFYLGYSKLQMNKNPVQKKYPREHYYNSNKWLLLLWNWIGAATHIFVLVLASFLYEPAIFFYYIIGLANVWMFLLAVIQIRVNKKIVIRD